MKNKHAYVLFGFVLLLAFIIWTLTAPAIYPGFDYSSTGNIGDTIGGISAPIIGIAGALLVYYSFQAQLTANDMQFKALTKEQKRYEDSLWREYRLNELNRKRLEFENLKIIYPHGNKLELFRYDKSIEMTGLPAFRFVYNSLIKSKDLNNDQIESIGEFIKETSFFLTDFLSLIKLILKENEKNLDYALILNYTARFYHQNIQAKITLIQSSFDNRVNQKIQDRIKSDMLEISDLIRISIPKD